jgi:GNAT superfamily N-acetyltransferase
VRTEIAIRPAGAADVPLLAESVTDGFAGYRDWAPTGWEPPTIEAASMRRLAARLQRRDVWCAIAFDGERVAGHVSLSPVTAEDPGPLPADEIFLWQMFVRRPWQGCGLASALMARAVEEATARGFARMRLWTPRGAARARRFYEREGWTPTGRAHEDSPSGLPTVEYERKLAAS